MSRSLAWVPKGPALEVYETNIRADLEATLANIELPEGAPLFLKLYMIGRDEDSANPVVMVCCVHRGIRREAEASIRESRILDSFPGVGLGSSALLLESRGLEELLTKVHITTNSGETHTMLTSVQGHQHEKAQSQSSEEVSDSGSTLEIYGLYPHTLGGTIRFVSTLHGEVPVVHATTGGPVFQLHTELYQITSGHGMRFGALESKTKYLASELDECEFDGQSDFDDDLATSIGSVTSKDSSAQSSEEDSMSFQSSGKEAPKAESQTPMAHAVHTRVQPDKSFPSSNTDGGSLTTHFERIYLQFHNPDLDYVLLKLPAQSGWSSTSSALHRARHERKTITTTSHVGPSHTRVFVVSPHGLIPGTIYPETTSYKMHGFTKIQQLLTVEIDSHAFLNGYSGSAVVDIVNGSVYGHIILGNPGQSLAYCVRAPDIFADILSRSGYVPMLDQAHWKFKGQRGIRPASVPRTTDTVSMDMSDKMPHAYGGAPLQSAGRELGYDPGALTAHSPLEEGTNADEPSRSKLKRDREDPEPPKSQGLDSSIGDSVQTWVDELSERMVRHMGPTATSPSHPSSNVPSPPSSPSMMESTIGSQSYRTDPTDRSSISTFHENEHGYDPHSKPNAAPKQGQTPAPDTPRSSNAPVEVFKSFRVSLDDPCYKVLPAALKKYHINAPWEQYALYIVYEDQERRLELEEKPLVLFKQLDKEGKKPMFMLRKIINTQAGAAEEVPGSAGLGSSTRDGYNPPGGFI